MSDESPITTAPGPSVSGGAPRPSASTRTTTRLPSPNRTSSRTSSSSSRTPSSTSAGSTAARPAASTSAYEPPARAASSIASQMTATASGWFSRSPRPGGGGQARPRQTAGAALPPTGSAASTDGSERGNRRAAGASMRRHPRLRGPSSMHRLLPAILLLVLASGCGAPGPAAGVGDAADVGLAAANVPRLTASPDDAVRAGAAVNAFGLDLFRRVAADDPDADLVLSPASIALALRCAGGARGQTAGEMDAVLRGLGATEGRLGGRARCRPGGAHRHVPRPVGQTPGRDPADRERPVRAARPGHRARVPRRARLALRGGAPPRGLRAGRRGRPSRDQRLGGRRDRAPDRGPAGARRRRRHDPAGAGQRDLPQGRLATTVHRGRDRALCHPPGWLDGRGADDASSGRLRYGAATGTGRWSCRTSRPLAMLVIAPDDLAAFEGSLDDAAPTRSWRPRAARSTGLPRFAAESRLELAALAGAGMPTAFADGADSRASPRRSGSSSTPSSTRRTSTSTSRAPRPRRRPR
jgi:hypothetical protein